jgi:hypothetical protein
MKFNFGTQFSSLAGENPMTLKLWLLARTDARAGDRGGVARTGVRCRVGLAEPLDL